MNSICLQKQVQSKIYFDLISYLSPSDSKATALFIKILSHRFQKEFSEVSPSIFFREMKKLQENNSFVAQLFSRVHQKIPYSHFWDFEVLYHGRDKIFFSHQLLFSSEGALLTLFAKEMNDQLISRQIEIFPAVQRFESDAQNFYSILSDSVKESFFFCGINYFEKEKKLLIPDPSFLTSRLKILIPDISIYYSDGILSDLDFIKAFFRYDLILSVNEEHFHDVTVHVFSQLKLMFEDLVQYRAVRKKMRDLIAKDLEKIEKVFVIEEEKKKMMALLGATVDSSLAASKLSILEGIEESHIPAKKISLLESSHWGRYFHKRFYDQTEKKDWESLREDWYLLLDKLYL